MAGSAAAQVDKKPYKNQTAGHLGVVKLDHLGGQIGANVPPHGTVWLSDDEALLTARAPQDPGRNPFVERPFEFYNENHEVVSQDMAPLVLITDEREVPSDERYVPGLSDEVPPTHIDVNKLAARRSDTEAALEASLDRPVAQDPADPVAMEPTSGYGVPSIHSRAGVPDTFQQHRHPADEPPPAEGERSGEDGEPNASESSGTGEGNGGAVEPSGQEETAGTIEQTGEETGAADKPAGAAPEGEFAATEEVATPDAPQQGGES